jgi:DHA1 family bicyclomycin/chloramphenicol resistance-like MFS transporter
MLRPHTFAMTALLAVLTSVGPLSTDMYLPSLPSIGLDLGASPAHVQLTISSYLAGFAVGQIVYGPISDQYGRKPVLVGSLLAFALASVGCTIATSIDMLIAMRVLQAFAAAGGVVLARAIVRDLYSGRRAARQLSVVAAIMALAPIIAPMFGGILQSAFGWQSVFFSLFGIGMFALLMCWFLLPETLPERTGPPATIRAMFGAFREFLTHRAFLANLALSTAAFAGLFAWISGSSFVLQKFYGLTPFTFGVAFSAGGLGFMIGTSLAATYVMRLGLDVTIGFGTLALASGGLAMATGVWLEIPSPLVLILPAAVYLFGLGLVLPQAQASALGPFPHRAGTASSLVGFTQQTVAAIVGIGVGHVLGTSALPLATIIAVLGCLSLALWVTTRSLRVEAQEP